MISFHCCGFELATCVQSTLFPHHFIHSQQSCLIQSFMEVPKLIKGVCAGCPAAPLCRWGNSGETDAGWGSFFSVC